MLETEGPCSLFRPDCLRTCLSTSPAQLTHLLQNVFRIPLLFYVSFRKHENTETWTENKGRNEIIGAELL